MNTHISIPKELLARIDYENTILGGMARPTVQAWREEEGYRLIINAPGVDFEDIHIEALNRRFVVYYTIDVLGGSEQMPHYLVNFPLSPEVDVRKIKAKVEPDGRIFVFAPFNDWSKGTYRRIEIQKD